MPASIRLSSRSRCVVIVWVWKLAFFCMQTIFPFANQNHFFANSISIRQLSTISSHYKWNVLSTNRYLCLFFHLNTVCSPGTFKPVVGDELCRSCPAHSKSSYRGATECRCDAGYYRAPKDPKGMPCTRKLNCLFSILKTPFLTHSSTEPPSAPQNLTISFVDHTTVILTWSPPKYLGGRNDTVYRVACEACSANVNYAPAQENFNETKVTISGLNAVTAYRLQVYAENGVTGYDTSQFVEVTATTETGTRANIILSFSSQCRHLRIRKWQVH